MDTLQLQGESADLNIPFRKTLIASVVRALDGKLRIDGKLIATYFQIINAQISGSGRIDLPDPKYQKNVFPHERYPNRVVNTQGTVNLVKERTEFNHNNPYDKLHITGGYHHKASATLKVGVGRDINGKRSSSLLEATTHINIEGGKLIVEVADNLRTPKSDTVDSQFSLPLPNLLVPPSFLSMLNDDVVMIDRSSANRLSHPVPSRSRGD